MRFLVYGAGAIGLVVGGLLIATGEDVTFAARGATLEGLQRRGFMLRIGARETRFSRVRTLPPPARSEGRPADPDALFDVILVCVKNQHLADVIGPVCRLCDERTLVVPLLNGVDAPRVFAERVRAERVVAAATRIGACVDRPGHVTKLGDYPPEIVLGSLVRGAASDLEPLRSAFELAGIRCDVTDDVVSALWQKMLLSTSFSGLATVLDAGPRELVTCAETCALLRELMEETVRVAVRCGARSADGWVEEAMGRVARMDPHHRTSLQQDLARGRPLEIDALTGAVVREAGRVDVAAPMHRFLHSSLVMLAARRAAASPRESSCSTC